MACPPGIFLLTCCQKETNATVTGDAGTSEVVESCNKSQKEESEDPWSNIINESQKEDSGGPWSNIINIPHKEEDPIPNIINNVKSEQLREIVITKGDQPLGLEVCCGHSCLVVTGISNGPLQDWNDANPKAYVSVGDIICWVNMFSGRAKDMKDHLDSLRNGDKVKMRTMTHKLESCMLGKISDDLGATIAKVPAGIAITAVSEQNGAIPRYNAANPGRPIRAPSVIVQANGKAGSKHIANVLNSEEPVEIKVLDEAWYVDTKV